VVADLRDAVRRELGYSCSAGIAHNKILAKLASGMHKPSQQTVVTLDCVPALMVQLPIPKLRQLGGKFGEEIMATLGITTVGALRLDPMLSLLRNDSNSSSTHLPSFKWLCIACLDGCQ
jgi:DNA polymerase eta